jgi:phosphoribosyl 1,2-cyclic phosphodiesterase
LAEQSVRERFRDQLSLLHSNLIFSNGIYETEKFLSQTQPDLIIIDRSFMVLHSAEFGKISRLYPALKFIPLIYIGSSSDENFDLLKHFRIVDCFEDTDFVPVISKASEHLVPSVRIRLWGVRGSTPCANFENMGYGGNTSCVEIDAPGSDDLLILDSGTGIRNLGNYLERHNSKNFNGRIFITHPHWDHIQGFPFFKPFYSSENKFSIHLPEQYRGGAQEILSGHLTKTFFPVTLDMLDAQLEYITQKEEPQHFSNYTIEYIVANHPTKTAIYKVTICGLTIVYAPDNELPLKTSPIRFLDVFEEFVKDCDLLIHDGQYTLRQYNDKVGWGHSAWERVVEVAKRNNVKKLFITHHDPDSNDDLLLKREEKLKQYESAPLSEVCLAKEGSEIRLPVKKK